MVPEVIFIVVLLLLAGGVAWYIVRRRAAHGDEDLYRLDVKLSADLKEEFEANFDDDEPNAEVTAPRVSEETEASSHHATRLLVGDQATEAFRPRDYFGMSDAESEIEVSEKEQDLADTAPVEPAAIESESEAEVEAPLCELPSLEGTLEFETDAPEAEVEPEVEAAAEVEVAAEEELVPTDEVEEIPAARASVPTETIPVVAAPEEAAPVSEPENLVEEEVEPVESEIAPEPESSIEPEPVDESTESAPITPVAPIAPPAAPESKPQGLFSRFVGGGAPKTPPVDLSDADDEFNAIDSAEAPEETLSALEELDPELAERLTTLNQRLAGLEDLVSDLEETLSVFDAVDPLDEAAAVEADADEAMAA